MSDAFLDIIEVVARRLLGTPNEKLSSKDELRFGAKGSISVDIKKGAFYDHEHKHGGGVLELIRHQGAGDPIAWLTTEQLINTDRNSRPNQMVTFDYQDESGILLFQVCRTSSKRFFQRRPDGQGDWIRNLDGVRRVPYRLPELVNGTGTIFIPEGEKHVDALLALGLRATCNPGGAGKWREEYNDFFRNADVVILPDNDEVGEKHAGDIARGLQDVAGKVRVFALPGLKRKGDILDWLASGGTKQQLLELVEGLSNLLPQEKVLFQSSADFVADFVSPNYLIDGILLKHYLYSLTAPTGAGKTCVAMRMAAHVAIGAPIAGREVDKSKVLFFAGENPDDVRARWIKLCEDMGREPKAMDVVFVPGVIPLSSEDIRKQIYVEARLHGPFGLVVVDTSAAYYQGDDENDNVQMGKHARMLRSLTELPGGPTVLVTCHPTKSPNLDNLAPRGGGAFVNEIDTNLVCLKRDGGVVEVWHHVKIRGPDFEPFPFRIQAGQSEKLKDSRGRKIWTVIAVPISEMEKSTISREAGRKQQELLALMNAKPGLSIAEQALQLGWYDSKRQPYRSAVVRAREALAKDKLVESIRGGEWVVTKAGAKAAPPWNPAQKEII